MQNILVLNCGSSSLKFQIVPIAAISNQTDKPAWLAKGLIERIGSQALIEVELADGQCKKEALALRDHKKALEYLLQELLFKQLTITDCRGVEDISAVGHRVVHGAEKFSKSTLIDQEVIKGIEACIELAPLHNLANLKGIEAATAIFGANFPQVAVFDTAFHASMPDYNYLYAIPYQLYRRHRIRRYGFHGTSHRYVSERYGQLNQLVLSKVNIVSLHLGNGCSACAIKEGQSYATSMGFTPLSGLIMGTRCGDIDPAIVDFLVHKEGFSLSEVDMLLNKQSGLLGISGLTNDMRDLLEEEHLHADRRAHLAITMFCKRIKHYIGAYMAELNGMDGLVFTAGIGENSVEIRRRVCENLENLGIVLDEKANAMVKAGQTACISAPQSQVKIWVIPTNEELIIAQDTAACLGLGSGQ